MKFEMQSYWLIQFITLEVVEFFHLFCDKF